jgi:hypothetical protein
MTPSRLIAPPSQLYQASSKSRDLERQNRIIPQGGVHKFQGWRSLPA